MTDASRHGDSKRFILDFLKKKGPSEARAIASALAVTAMAVRQHLYELAAVGAVKSVRGAQRPSRGRPSKLWMLDVPPVNHFPDAHAELSAELIGNIREVFGEAGLDKLISRRTQAQIAQYRQALAGATSAREKLKRVAALRSEAGYMAEVQSDGDGFLLLENHCPVCRAAAACSGLCRQELEVFRAAMGREFSVERSEHILNGARRCAYKIRQKKS